MAQDLLALKPAKLKNNYMEVRKYYVLTLVTAIAAVWVYILVLRG